MAESVSDTVSTALGLVKSATYYNNDAEAMSGNRLYMLTMIDYGDGAFPKDSLVRQAQFFATTVESAAAAVGGDVMISSMLESGYPAWQFRIDYGEEGRRTSVHNRVYIVSDTYYHLQVFAFHKDEGVRARERFFKGFFIEQLRS